MKKILITIILSLFISGLFFYFNFKKIEKMEIKINQENQSLIKYKKIYDNKEYNISFIYPTTWEIIKNIDQNTLAIFKTKEDNVLGIFYVEINNIITNTDDLMMYLNEFYKDAGYINTKIEKQIISGKNVLIIKNIPGISSDQSGYIISFPKNEGFIQITGENNKLYKEIFDSLIIE